MRITAVSICAIGVSLLGVSTGNTAPYSFDVIADTNGRFSEFGNNSSINCSGTVAFSAANDDGAGVYVSNDQSTTVIHESGAPLANYFNPSINDAGTVAFRHKPEGDTQSAGQLRIGDGISSNILVDGQGEYALNPSINNIGQVAYSGRHDSNGVFANDGRRIVRIASSGTTVTGVSGNGVSINDNGDVAFSARIGSDTRAMVVGDGVNLRVIADSNGELTRFWEPAINNAGQVIFHAGRPVKGKDGQAHEPVIAMSDGRKTETIADSSGALIFYGSSVSINNHGNYAYTAILRGHIDDGRGIYTGPDSISDKVIRPGDQISGQTVKALNLGWSALNDAGQIVFKAEFDDGTQGIVVANPTVRTEADCAAPLPRTLIVSSEEEKAKFRLESTVRPSRWIELEKKRYRDVLSAIGYDALIIPFQPAGHTIDAAGRTMLARILADQLSDVTGMRIADPGIVEKAFGQPARFVEIDDVFEFGRELGVEIIIFGRIGHDRGYRMTIDVDTYRDRPGNVTPLSQLINKQWRDVAFSDDRPPMIAFEPLAAELTALITGSDVPREKTSQSLGADSGDVPLTWEEFLTRSKSSPLDAALQLEFLASLFPAENMSRAQEHLYERALIALRDMEPTSTGLPLLRARALMGLHRRPAALAALGEPKTNAEHAFLAYLNGDLPGLERYWKIIDEPVHRLLAEIDLQTVRAAYDHPSRFDRIDEAIAEYPSWYGFILQRIVENSRGSIQSHILTKTGLDSIGPAGNITAEEFMNAKYVAGDFPDELDLVGSILNHVNNTHKLIEKPEVIEPENSNVPYLDDLLQLAVDLTVANAIAEARVESTIRGRPAEALQIISKYDALFTDHPLLSLEKSDNLKFSGNRNGRDEDFVRYLSQAFVWLGRQTRLDMVVLHNPETFFPELLDGPTEDRHIALYDFDFPGRPDIAFRFATESEAELWHWENCYRYALFRVECLSNLHYQLSNGPNSDPEAAEEVLRQFEYRFIGHQKYLEVLTAIKRESGEPDDEEKMLQAAIQAESTEWFPYESLGVMQMRDGRYADASATFLAYPGFSDTSLANNITLSNRSYNVGSLLYWAGAYERARPLYEISAGLGTGSGASLSSAARLSILDGDLQQAADITLQRARRYDEKFAYRDYMAFLHLQGRSNESWTLFDALMQNDAVYGPQLWTSAYLGHRINGTTDQQIIEWAMDPRHTFLTKGKIHEFPVRFVFLMNVVDRLPSAELESTIREIHPDFRNDANRTVIRVQDEYTDLETNFSYDHHRTALAARGLAHFHRGQLEKAFAAFDQIGPSRNIKEFLPYYAWCAVQTNQRDRLDKIMESAPIRIKEMEGDGHTGYQFDDYLAQSLLAGASGNHKDALKLLRRALNHRAFTESRKIFTYYQVLEVAEILYKHTGEDAFRQLGFDLAHRFTVIQPMYPWAYSFAAQFAESADQRIPYLATAMQLDPKSWRANRASEEDQERAREWLKTHGPLYERRSVESDSI